MRRIQGSQLTSISIIYNNNDFPGEIPRTPTNKVAEFLIRFTRTFSCYISQLETFRCIIAILEYRSEYVLFCFNYHASTLGPHSSTRSSNIINGQCVRPEVIFVNKTKCLVVQYTLVITLLRIICVSTASQNRFFSCNYRIIEESRRI